MKNKVRKLMALIIAAAMLSAVAMPVSATEGVEEGCGKAIQFLGSNTQGGWNCGTSGGVSGCISGVVMDIYSCFPQCKPGYNGYILRCNAGHLISINGQVTGYC